MSGEYPCPGEPYAVVSEHHQVLAFRLLKGDGDLARSVPWESVFQGIRHQLVDYYAARDRRINAQPNVFGINREVDIWSAESV